MFKEFIFSPDKLTLLV